MKRLLFLSFFISNLAFSKGCYQSNLFDTNDNLAEMPIQNQGNFNTCYAHSLSAAYEALTGLDLHPYSVAHTHKKRALHWKPRNLNYSFSVLAWGDIKRKGACLKSEVEARIKEYLEEIPYNDDQFFYAIRTFYKHQGLETALISLENDPFLRGEPWRKEDLVRLFHKIPFDKTKDYFDFLGKYIFNDCQEIFPFEKIKTSGLGFAKNSKLERKIHEVLKTNQPAIAGFCIDQLKEDPTHKTTFPRILMPLKASCGAHYVLVAGEDMINNKCQLLIRNSHGEGFWATNDQTCYCENKETKERSLCHKESFDASKEIVLGCYYDKEDFLRQTFEISKIE